MHAHAEIGERARGRLDDAGKRRRNAGSRTGIGYDVAGNFEGNRDGGLMRHEPAHGEDALRCDRQEGGSVRFAVGRIAGEVEDRLGLRVDGADRNVRLARVLWRGVRRCGSRHRRRGAGAPGAATAGSAGICCAGWSNAAIGVKPSDTLSEATWIGRAGRAAAAPLRGSAPTGGALDATARRRTRWRRPAR
jgi:hypothetical protein